MYQCKSGYNAPCNQSTKDKKIFRWFFLTGILSELRDPNAPQFKNYSQAT